MDPYSADIPELLQAHLDHLLGSAISIAVIRERGYRTVMGKAELKEAGFSKAQQQAPGILIPLHDPAGNPAGFLYRPDKPRTGRKDKPIKYEAPRSSSLRLDMPLRCKETIGDPSVPLWFTEGSKKADALASNGACAISLNGVWGFKGKNEFGGTTLLADFDFITLKDRLAYLAFDSDSTTNPRVRQALERFREHLRRKEARVMVVNLPQGPDGEKTGVDDYLAADHTIQDLISLASDTMPGDEPVDEPLVLHNTPYKVVQERFCVIRSLKDVGRVYSPLCNFTARIREEIIHDNGLEEERRFVVDGTLAGGKRLPRVEIPAASFSNLNWVPEQWGAGAIVYAGASTKDHLRCMIQMTMNGSEPRRVFTHTGWREIDGERVFLTASGALGREGLEVDLPGRLAQYRLPTDLDKVNPARAVKSSIDFMNLGNPEVMIPLWAAMYLSVFSEILEPDFTLWTQGRTDSFKSTLNALALCHFGEFTSKTLPTNWGWTAFRLQMECFAAKDLPLVIDNWLPGGSREAQKELEKKAQIVIQGIGDRQGRGRMTQSARRNDTPGPRGVVLSTGEQLPDNESTLARLFILYPEPDDVDPALLTIAQEEDAPMYPYAMANYIRWVGTNYDHLKSTLPKKWSEARNRAFSAHIHRRLLSSVAHLYTGLETGLSFALETGVITDREFSERKDAGWEVLIGLAAQQDRDVKTERPSQRFIESFKTLLEQERIVVIDRKYSHYSEILRYLGERATSMELKPTQAWGGWEDEDFFYIIPEITYTTVNDFCCRGGGRPLGKRRAVWDDMRRAGMTECRKDISYKTGYRNDVVIQKPNGEWTTVIKLYKAALRYEVAKGPG